MFRVADGSGAAVTGLVNGDFTKQLYKDAATDATSITVTEVANGWYRAVYTPASTGFWLLHVTHATYNVAGWQDEIDVVADPLALSATERNAIADALLDRTSGIETSVTPRQALRAIAAVTTGVIADANTGTETFKAIGNSGTTRVTVTVDASGNRSAVVLA